MEDQQIKSESVQTRKTATDSHRKKKSQDNNFADQLNKVFNQFLKKDGDSASSTVDPTHTPGLLELSRDSIVETPQQRRTRETKAQLRAAGNLSEIKKRDL